MSIFCWSNKLWEFLLKKIIINFVALCINYLLLYSAYSSTALLYVLLFPLSSLLFHKSWTSHLNIKYQTKHEQPTASKSITPQILNPILGFPLIFYIPLQNLNVFEYFLQLCIVDFWRQTEYRNIAGNFVYSLKWVIRV